LKPAMMVLATRSGRYSASDSLSERRTVRTQRAHSRFFAYDAQIISVPVVLQSLFLGDVVTVFTRQRGFWSLHHRGRKRLLVAFIPVGAGTRIGLPESRPREYGEGINERANPSRSRMGSGHGRRNAGGGSPQFTVHPPAPTASGGRQASPFQLPIRTPLPVHAQPPSPRAFQQSWPRSGVSAERRHAPERNHRRRRARRRCRITYGVSRMREASRFRSRIGGVPSPFCSFCVFSRLTPPALIFFVDNMCSNDI
jgi:hypothetical protein